MGSVGIMAEKKDWLDRLRQPKNRDRITRNLLKITGIICLSVLMANFQSIAAMKGVAFHLIYIWFVIVSIMLCGVSDISYNKKCKRGWPELKLWG